jgi:hypothetical protein
MVNEIKHEIRKMDNLQRRLTEIDRTLARIQKELEGKK